MSIVRFRALADLQTPGVMSSESVSDRWEDLLTELVLSMDSRCDESRTW